MTNDVIPTTDLRQEAIPIWINCLTVLIIFILAFQSYSAYLDTSLAFGGYSLDSIANKEVMSKLAGRNVVMLLLTLMALQSQNPVFLAFTFLMHLLRELQDMFIVPYYHGFATPKGMAVLCVFLFVFVILEFLVLLKLKKLAAKPE